MARGVSMILLIGCGNSLRRDDGAGLVLAELLERSWQLANSRVQRISVHQLTPELAERIAAESVSLVVFFDSRLTTEMQGKCVVEVQPLALTSSSPSLAHHCNPETAMLYARLLNGTKVPSWKIAIGGRDFAHGEGLSPMAQEAIAETLDVVGLSPHAWLTRMEAKTLHRHAPTPMFYDCNTKAANILYKL
jgi:hydrogenase maturation protease